jgi:hypothetical protein
MLGPTDEENKLVLAFGQAFPPLQSNWNLRFIHCLNLGLSYSYMDIQKENNRMLMQVSCASQRRHLMSKRNFYIGWIHLPLEATAVCRRIDNPRLKHWLIAHSGVGPLGRRSERWSVRCWNYGMFRYFPLRSVLCSPNLPETPGI